MHTERGGPRGTCVFADGSVHLAALRAGRDRTVRSALRDAGFGVIEVIGDEFEQAVRANPAVFGSFVPRE